MLLADVSQGFLPVFPNAHFAFNAVGLPEMKIYWEDLVGDTESKTNRWRALTGRPGCPHVRPRVFAKHYFLLLKKVKLCNTISVLQ